MELQQKFKQDHLERIHRIFGEITEGGQRRFAGFATSKTNGDDTIPQFEMMYLKPHVRTAVFYTDGSWIQSGEREGLLSAAAAHKQGNHWVTISDQLGRHVGNNNDAEVYGISLALKTAYDQIQDGQEIGNIIVFSDSQSVVKMLEPKCPSDNIFQPVLGPVPKDGRWALAKVFWYADVFMKAGIPVHVRWIRGHDSIEGNIQADSAARRANEQQHKDLGKFNPCSPIVTIPYNYENACDDIKKEYLYRLSWPWFRSGIGRCHLLSVFAISPTPPDRISPQVENFMRQIDPGLKD